MVTKFVAGEVAMVLQYFCLVLCCIIRDVLQRL